ncbi:MAG TPA: glycosyltransferase [Ktedonobacteraceae bacterium]
MKVFAKILQYILALLMLGERIWKHWMVVRFFERRIPPQSTVAQLVSILQPILSGDPTLVVCLEQNLQLLSNYQLEYIWLVDSNDYEGQRICLELMQRYPRRNVQLILVSPPGDQMNPKMVKLIAGARVAQGEIICVLDDDTMLPDYGLEECLPYLDQPGVGLAFGLPYYVNFSNLWSGLVAYFVNSNSLLTYIPYTLLTEPFTINGMFYAMKRKTLQEVGGFTGLEKTLADDFAIAQRIREHGLRLIQTPLRHGISTQVDNPRSYRRLIQRWFIFPRESLMRYLSLREQCILYGLALFPVFLPLFLVLSLLLRPSRTKVVFVALYFGYDISIFTHFNHWYLHNASPLDTAWYVPLLRLLTPLQLLVALLSPQRIHWRGNLIRVEKGGCFRIVQHRTNGQEM